MNKKSYELIKDTIVIERELTELDLFVKDFLEILKRHSDYLIVSGFVSISTGRIRGTEDIDILVPLEKIEKFKNLFEDLIENSFWCYQSESYSEAYEYFKNLNNIRFARKNEIFPNMEVVPVTKERKAKYFEFTNPQKIKIKDFEFKIPWIEFEITYKEKVLAGKKDIEDAAHLRAFFSEILDEEKFNKSKEVIKDEIKN